MSKKPRYLKTTVELPKGEITLYDDWTKMPDGRWRDRDRIRALGNSMAVPVMGWVGRRIQLADSDLPRLHGLRLGEIQPRPILEVRCQHGGLQAGDDPLPPAVLYLVLEVLQCLP